MPPPVAPCGLLAASATQRKFRLRHTAKAVRTGQNNGCPVFRNEKKKNGLRRQAEVVNPKGCPRKRVSA